MAVAIDYASAMISFMDKLKEYMREKYKIDICHIRCAAHILNLIVSVLHDRKEMKDSITTFRNAIKVVRGSSKLKLKLHQYSQLNEEPNRKLILDFQIRWNLTFDMLQVNVTPLYKKGDKTVATNYRPVSLTSVPCKILEGIIRNKIEKYFYENKLLAGQQH